MIAPTAAHLALVLTLLPLSRPTNDGTWLRRDYGAGAASDPAAPGYGRTIAVNG
jgi:hypothetical protein